MGSLGGRLRVELLSQKHAAGCPRTTNAGASLTTGSGAEIRPPSEVWSGDPGGRLDSAEYGRLAAAYESLSGGFSGRNRWAPDKAGRRAQCYRELPAKALYALVACEVPLSVESSEAAT